MKEYVVKRLKPLSEFGCYVALSYDGKSIWTCPMLTNGQPSVEELSEVVAPEQGFLKKINELYLTKFEMSQFPGR